MELQAEMRRAGGVIRARELFERGITVHQLRTACARRQVVRPARGWVALPDADSDLVHALQHGMSITCVSLAQRLGLWVRHADQPHLAARSPHAHAQADCGTVHWGRPVFRREPFAVVDSIENALNYIARCQPYEEALAIWESALQQELVSKDALVRLPYRGTARRILEACTLFSGSGLESYVLRRLRALRLHVVPQAWVLGRRVDFLIERNVFWKSMARRIQAASAIAIMSQTCATRLPGMWLFECRTVKSSKTGPRCSVSSWQRAHSADPAESMLGVTSWACGRAGQLNSHLVAAEKSRYAEVVPGGFRWSLQHPLLQEVEHPS